MIKSDPKFRRFANLQGHLEKLSSNFLLGYQSKFWKVIDDGTKIGYSNQPGEPIKAENIFLIKECFASEASGDTIFQLRTRDKVFMLKAPNEEERTDWIKGLTFLKKVLNNQIKLKNQISPTETTIASRSEKLKTKKIPKVQTSPSINIERPRVYQPEDLLPDINLESDLIQELIKYLPQKCLKYYTLLTNLKVKSQGLFMNSMNASTYLLISPKSLYPQIYIGDENLTNLSLPPWLEVNYFYKIQDINSKQKKKQIFHTSKIIDIQQGSECSIKINTGQVIYQFFTDNVEQKECLKSCLELAVDNAEEVVINGKISKKNYDKLVDLHETKLPEFQKQAKAIIASFQKKQQQPKYQPPELFQFMDKSMQFLQQFITILEHKKKNKDHVILDMLKLFHEEVKTQAKLTWDSSFYGIKGIHILNMLKKLSEYYQLMKNFIKSAEFLEGMKQLSKIYVRQSWKNFQSIIMSIVQQQKTKNLLEDEQTSYIQTHGVTDLFKFIYSVFDLAYPHWKNKIHLHNVNRLMQRALQVFVNQLRSMIDQEVLSGDQMVALANNYFCFNDYVREFCADKFQELVDKTSQAYEKIVKNYRQVSMIILQKIAHSIGTSIQQYCHKCTIQTLKPQPIQQILQKSLHPLQKSLHMAFLNKLSQKIAKQVQIKICEVVAEQVQLKKRVKIKEIVRCVREIRSRLNLVFDRVCRNHVIMDKKMEELEVILSYDLISDIEEIIVSNTDPLKRIYLKILELRQDFHQGSILFKIVTDHSSPTQQNPEINRGPTKRRVSIDPVIRQKHATLSKQYFLQEIMDSDQNSNGEERSVSQTKKVTEGSKLISEGYLTKGKRNKKVWEKSYFRLKNGFLYIFQTADSQKCHNAIQIKNITKIDVPNPQKPSFLLTYKTLTKQKQIKLKSDSLQLRQRWVNSLQLEKKRMMNQEQVKKKSAKYKETQNSKKYQMIIDYQELEKGKDYFSYSG